MPLYGFICDECNSKFEELVMSAGQADEVICPECASPKVQRQLSMIAGLGSQSSGSSASSSAACSSGGG
jgi:putative FmdB family regulatory protein